MTVKELNEKMDKALEEYRKKNPLSLDEVLSEGASLKQASLVHRWMLQ